MSVFIVFVMLLWSGISWGYGPTPQVSASKFEKGNAPANAIDENTSTHWTCRGYEEECWFQVDAGDVIVDNEIMLNWKSHDTRETFFDIRASTDGENWTTIFSGSSDDYADELGYPDNVNSNVYRFASTEFRYLRIVGHGNDASDHNTLVEFQWDDPESYYAFYERIPAAITASSHNKGNTPERAIDGNLATHWTADSGEWLQIDLGLVDTVELVKIAWLSGDQRKSDFDIEVSTDGVDWNLVYSAVSAGRTSGLEVNQLPEEFCARYVRITGWGNNHPTQKNLNSVTEIEIWGRSEFEGSHDCSGSDAIDVVAGRM